MFNINIVCVGTLKESYLREAAAEYSKRLSRFCKLTVIEIEESTPEKEKINILRACKGVKVALCVEGKEISSENLAKKLYEYALHTSFITFIIGSSTGLSEEIKFTADMCLSFSLMTFPHQLMRVILLEQVYRAFTINNNVKYHK